MAASIQGPSILLGYEDEQVSEKYVDSVDFTTNKIGGQPVRKKIKIHISYIAYSICDKELVNRFRTGPANHALRLISFGAPYADDIPYS